MCSTPSTTSTGTDWAPLLNSPFDRPDPSTHRTYMQTGTIAAKDTLIGSKPGLNILDLLRPYRRQLWFGLLAIAGESAADLLQPWPLKIVLDNVLQSKSRHGWLNEDR